jgi:hypothetical protein
VPQGLHNALPSRTRPDHARSRHSNSMAAPPGAATALGGSPTVSIGRLCSSGKPPIARPGQLVPTAQKATDGVIEVELYIVPRLRDRAIREVAAPAPHGAVQRAGHILPWRLVAGPPPVANGVPDGREGLLRWLHPVVAPPVRGEYIGLKV